MIAIGVDPGLAGALAIVCHERGLLRLRRLPVCVHSPGSSRTIKRKIDARALGSLMSQDARELGLFDVPCVAVIEQMAPFTGGPGVTTLLSLGYTAGLVEGVLVRYAAKILQPLPQQWKRTYRLRGDKTASKVVAHDIAGSAASMIKTHDDAEAVLLAFWGLQQFRHATPVVAQPGDFD